VPIQAGHAQPLRRQLQRLDQSGLAEIPQRIGGDELPDGLHAVSRGDQLSPAARVDAVETRIPDRRGGDARVHLGRAGGAQHADDLPAGRPPHDGVVDQHHPPAVQDIAQRVELHPDPEVARGRIGLDERPADVAVLDESDFQRDARRFGESHRGGDAGIGHGDHHVGLRGMLAGQDAAHAPPRQVDGAAGQHRVRPREVDVLEDAVRDAAGRQHLDRSQTSSVQDDEFPRIDVADGQGAEVVKRTGL